MNKIICTLLFFMPLFSIGQDYNGISEAFKSGNSSALAKMFDPKIEYIADGVDQSLARGEAENKMQSFFIAHAPRNFTILHKGVSQNDLYYLIGELTTSKGNFRTTIYLHKMAENYLLQSLEIEEL
jgi:hypothetical protein